MTRKSKAYGYSHIKTTHRKRPGRHSKKPNKRQHYKAYVGQGRK